MATHRAARGTLQRLAVVLSGLLVIATLADGSEVDSRRTTVDKTELMRAAKSAGAAKVETLLKSGANPNTATRTGGTALMFAAASGRHKVVELLIDYGADVNARSSNGWSALMVATAKGYSALIHTLLAAGADPNAPDVYAWTPLHRAAYDNQLRALEALLTTPVTHLNARDDHGATPLHHAAGQGNKAIVQRLLAHGADPGVQDHTRRTAQDYANALLPRHSALNRSLTQLLTSASSPLPNSVLAPSIPQRTSDE